MKNWITLSENINIKAKNIAMFLEENIREPLWDSKVNKCFLEGYSIQ